jgi:hypothetical protein
VIDGDQLPREGLRRQKLEDDIEDLIGKSQQDRGLATWSLHHTFRGRPRGVPSLRRGCKSHGRSTMGESVMGTVVPAVVSGPLEILEGATNQS